MQLSFLLKISEQIGRNGEDGVLISIFFVSSTFLAVFCVSGLLFFGLFGWILQTPTGLGRWRSWMFMHLSHIWSLRGSRALRAVIYPSEFLVGDLSRNLVTFSHEFLKLKVNHKSALFNVLHFSFPHIKKFIAIFAYNDIQGWTNNRG